MNTPKPIKTYTNEERFSAFIWLRNAAIDSPHASCIADTIMELRKRVAELEKGAL